ncbi:transposase [Salmonella enterica]
MTEGLQVYASNQSNKEWEIASKRMQASIKNERPRKWEARRKLDAIFYVEKTDCQWRHVEKRVQHVLA